MRERTVLLGGLGFAEGPRWHEGRLWFSDMGAGQVRAVDLDGRAEVVLEVPGRPSGLGWLPDGRLLVVSMADRRVLRREHDGAVVEHADLAGLASFDCNDMVVDGQGRAWVGNAGFDLSVRPLQVRPAQIVLVTPDGRARVVDDEVVFPNGSVVTPTAPPSWWPRPSGSASPPSPSPPTAAWPTGACSPTSAVPLPTASASTRRERCGSPTPRGRPASGSGRVARW